MIIDCYDWIVVYSVRTSRESQAMRESLYILFSSCLYELGEYPVMRQFHYHRVIITILNVRMFELSMKWRRSKISIQ